MNNDLTERRTAAQAAGLQRGLRELRIWRNHKVGKLFRLGRGFFLVLIFSLLASINTPSIAVTYTPAAQLTFTSLTPSEIRTSTAPYAATLSAVGSNFTNVNQVTFTWSGAANGSQTWNRGDSYWNAGGVTINSDTSMTLRPIVVERNPTWSGTATWTVTLRDTTGATASRSFTVTYTPSESTIDARIESYSPNSLVEVQVGNSVTLSVTFRNTGNTAWTFWAKAVITSNGSTVAEYGPTSASLQPNQSTTLSWTHTVTKAGDFSLQFGVWKDSAGATLLAWTPSQVLIRGVSPPSTIDARIESYSPNSLVEVQVGNSVTLSVTFRNTGNTAWTFWAKALITSNGSTVAEYGPTSASLQPNQSTTLRWTHTVTKAGDFWLQFAVWKDSQTPLDRKPSPPERLIRGITVPGCSLTCTATVPATALVNARVSFGATATPSGCTGSVTYEWDFGDGSAHSTDQNPVHTYTRTGTFNWTMSARISGASPCTKSGSINVVESTAPTANFTWTPTSPQVGQSVQFIDASTGAPPLTWAWDFNSDGVTDSTAQNPTHVFTNPGPFQVTLKVSNPYGEARVNKTVNVGSAAGVPVITNVRRQYPGVFLAGSNLDNTFEVTVDWKGTPGTVSFSINGGPAVVKRGTSSGASHTFRMGTDFQPSWSPSTVTIMPTNGEGKTGEPWREYVYIFPYPTWLQQAITRDPSSLTGSPDTSGWRYSVNVEFPIPHLGENEETKIPDILVPILGRRFGVKETFGYIRGEFSSNGNGMVSVYGQTGFEAMGKSIEGRVGGSGEFRLSAPRGLELTWASLNVGFNGTISEEKDILLVIPKLAWAEKIPKIGNLIREFNKRATLEFQISPFLDLTCGFAQGGSGDLEFSEGTATLGLDAKGILKVPIVEKRLSARAWVGGGGNFTLGVPRPFIRGAEFLLQPGVELTVDFWNLRFCPRAIYNYGCKWNPGSGWDCDHGGSFDEECGQTSGSGLPVNEVDPALTAQEGSSQGSLSLIETNYAQFGPYSVFHPTSLIKSASAEIPASVQETTLISNLFAGASPMILATEGGKLLLWVHQDPALPVLQSTDISWSYNDGSGWSTPTLITHDTQAELSPVAGVDTNGKVVAAWLRIKDPAFSAPINSIGDLPLFYTQLEVVSAVFDPLTRTWGPIAQLTDDTAFDTDLRLSSDGKGRLLLTWLSNPCGEFISTSACPSTLKYSFWNGSNWSTPRVVDVGLVGVSTHAAAVYGTKAFIIVPREGVLDLYTWTGSGWSRASTFAAGGVENRLPSVAYDAKGEGHIVWLRGDDLVHATLSDPRPRVARAGSRSLAFYSARLLSNPQGNLTLVWQEVSDNGPANIFAMIYDPASQSWSADRRLNQGTWMAHDVSGYYGSDGLLHLVYLATDIERTTETVQIGGKAWTITNVPREGRTDLRLLEHSLVIDLAVTDGDIRITPERPRPGDFVTATVVVHNAGDFPVGSFFVNIYAGNPDVGGTLLGSSRVTGPVRAGDRRIIRFSFVYPETGGNIIAVVDANNDVTEFTEANNRATLYLDNTAPVARVVASVTSGRAPLTVNFDASASFDREGDTMSFSWAFADGSPSASGMTVSHTFSRPGRYPVVVAVTDAKGAVGTAIVTITVDPACTYSIAPTGRDFPASGGSGSVSVKAPSGCAWQAVSNDSWITITSGSTGSGNGTVNYSVAANASASQRTGTMTIAGQTFTVTQAGAPGGSAPTATTGSATNVTSNSATLNATVNPNGLATTVYFQWGTSPSYGNSTSSQSIGSGTNTVNVSANLSGLSPDTTYYYRIVATNSAGTTYGSGMSFRTDGSGLRAEFVKLQSGEITSISDAIALLNNPRSNPRVAFIHNGVVDFTDDEGAPYGFFPRQFRFEDIPILSGDPNNFAARFTGFIRIPAGPPPNTYTFAVGSDDGFRLTINDGTRDHVAEYAGLRAIGVGPLLQITFPPQGGLFPIELVYFESGGGAILEFSFARGAQNIFSTSTFTLVSPSMLSAANSRAHIFYYPWYGSPRTDGR